MGQQRSEEFRKAAVVKFHSRGSRTVEEIAQGLGVSSWSLGQPAAPARATKKAKSTEGLTCPRAVDKSGSLRVTAASNRSRKTFFAVIAVFVVIFVFSAYSL